MNNWIYDAKPDTRRAVLAVTESAVAGSLIPRRKIVRAEWIPARSEESQEYDDTDGIDEYVEEEDCYYIREGWYELIDYWEEYGYIAIDDPVICWCELPELPA